VRRALRSLDEVTLRPFTADACIERAYTRQNFDYKPLHALCRFFLEGSSPSQETGEYSMLPFLIDMERLFEQFLGEWLRRNLSTQWKLQTQHRVPLEDNLAFRIDFVVNDVGSEATALVADAKYKAVSQPSTQDIAQVVAYAKSKHCHNAVLIYPQELHKAFNIHVGDVRVRSVVFDLGSDWKKGKRQFFDELLKD
jgi:5-methylcytosine-specific restriction enzyme subunit McrC